MSPSSAFSHRRQLLRRPKICLPPPPPPPPPPPTWPATCFSAWVQYTFPWEEGPITRDFTTQACRDPDESWWWSSAFAADPVGTVDWFVSPGAWNATLNVSHFDEDAGDFLFESVLYDITPGVTTPYSITLWSVKPGPDWECTVLFDF